MVPAMVSLTLNAIYSILFEPASKISIYNLTFLSQGKKYCYGGMEGEYCHCDYCKVFPSYFNLLSSLIFSTAGALVVVTV